jgi:tetratricopeptide (TPR) repeat protein
MNPKDLIEGGLLQSSDLDGALPSEQGAELGPLGRYELLEELGRGGSAIVYRARDPLLNRDVALKRLRFGDLELEGRFLREAGLLARLSHPGIIPVFDFGREGDSLYYTMPLAPGLTLDLWVAERRADVRETARVVREAAEALAHAHEHGVLHRDVKPANILVSAEGRALVADFGLGRAEDPASREEGRVTESGEVIGTPCYMAPEVASGGLKRVDARCDVYSLGATLYEALTGMPPFVGGSALEILRRIEAEEPTAPRKLVPTVPTDLEVICLKALEKDPARRYETAREFADDLGRFLSGEPIRARRASPVYRLRRRIARRKALVAVALAGVVAAAGILIHGVLRERDAEARRHRASNHLNEAGRHIGEIDRLLNSMSETDPEVEKQANRALDRIRLALEEDPDNAEAYFLKGRTYALRFDRLKARENYDIAISTGAIAQAHLERAILDCQDLVEMQAGGTPPGDRRLPADLRRRIEEDLKKVREITSLPNEGDFAEGLLEISKGSAAGYRKAAGLLEAYLPRKPDWRGFYWKGIAEMQLGQMGKAETSLTKALERRPKTRFSAFIIDRLAVVLYSLGLPGESIKRFEEAIARDPELVPPYFHLASVLEFRKDYEGAIRLSRSAIQRDPEAAEAHAVLGISIAKKHRKDPSGGLPDLREARERLEFALRAFGDHEKRSKALRVELDYVLSQLAKLEGRPQVY